MTLVLVTNPTTYGTEGSIFAPNAASPSAVSTFLANNYPRLTANHTAAILSHYASTGPLPPLPQHAPWFPTASLAYGEATFVCPNLNVLNYISTPPSSPSIKRADTKFSSTSTTTEKRKRFVYRYNVHDAENWESGLGVPHLFEAAAIFGPENIGHARASYFSYNAPIVPLVMGYWISFVRALDPNPYKGRGSPEWEEWTGGEGGLGEMRRLVIELGKTRMETVNEGEKGRCEFWRELGGVMEQKV